MKKISAALLMLCAAAVLLQPVMADNGTITIAYRGSGGSYIGETVVFDGRNTYGNTTLLKISGTGLPAEGVPVNNLNGSAGTATPVSVDEYGAWKFVWYASSIPGIEKLRTARYTFTATDSLDPAKSATTVFMLKKPEYSISASPDPATPGHYIEIIGTAEQGITYAKIEIKDSSGSVLHTYTSPVSSSGYFSYGFHEDMGPGQYQVIASNPALKAPFSTTLSVVAEGATLPVTAVMSPGQDSATPVAGVTAEMTSEAIPEQVPVPSPTRSPVAPVTVLAALVISVIALAVFRRL